MCVYMCVSDCCPTRQLGGHEPQVKSIHPGGAFTYQAVCERPPLTLTALSEREL